MTVSITKLERYGESGWSWVVGGDTKYRTNRAGDGLWQIGSYEGDWADNYQDKQIEGTCQFSLPSGKRAARAKLYREFREDDEF